VACSWPCSNGAFPPLVRRCKVVGRSGSFQSWSDESVNRVSIQPAGRDQVSINLSGSADQSSARGRCAFLNIGRYFLRERLRLKWNTTPEATVSRLGRLVWRARSRVFGLLWAATFHPSYFSPRHDNFSQNQLSDSSVFNFNLPRERSEPSSLTAARRSAATAILTARMTKRSNTHPWQHSNRTKRAASSGCSSSS